MKNLPTLKSYSNLFTITCPCCKHSTTSGYVIHREYDYFKSGPKKGQIKTDKHGDPKVVETQEDYRVTAGDEFIRVDLSNHIEISFVGMHSRDDYYYNGLLACQKCKTVFVNAG